MSLPILELPKPLVQHADDNDLMAAIRAVEARTGLSFEQLRSIARADGFTDMRTRSAWQSISVLDGLMG